MAKTPIKKWLIPAICAVIAAAAVVAIVLLLQPKGGVAIVKKWKPQRASADVEPYARRAIDIIDSYLGFEISGSEAKAAFDEVRRRMDELDIVYDDKKYTAADDVVDHCVLYSYFDADSLEDSEYREYRDLLAFQIGEPVSGRTYPARQTHYDEEDQLCEIYFDEHLTLASRYSYDAYNAWISVSAEFDYMNGVEIEDAYKAFECAHSNFSKTNPDSKYSISVTYKYYGQDVFSLNAGDYGDGEPFWIQSAIDFHTMDLEDVEQKTATVEFEDMQSLKKELEKMSAAFDP